MSNLRFWFHVPLETTRGDWLKPPPNNRLSVLGRSARLTTRDTRQNANSLTNAGTAVVAQCLLFDPIPESEAEALLAELRAKMPVLSHRNKAALRIAASPIHRAEDARFNGPVPTLIPERFQPKPMWMDVSITSYMEAADVLGAQLSKCPSVNDERLLAAIQLDVASRYDVLPRSIFLAQLTILDSLAVRSDRPPAIQAWLDSKIAEAKTLNDQGLASSLGGLKKNSHGAALRQLVVRAGKLKNMTPEKIKEFSDLAGSLYGTRSSLSHAGASKETLDVNGARKLVSLVLDAAIEDPSILEP